MRSGRVDPKTVTIDLLKTDRAQIAELGKQGGGEQRCNVAKFYSQFIQLLITCYRLSYRQDLLSFAQETICEYKQFLETNIKFYAKGNPYYNHLNSHHGMIPNYKKQLEDIKGSTPIVAPTKKTVEIKYLSSCHAFFYLGAATAVMLATSLATATVADTYFKRTI